MVEKSSISQKLLNLVSDEQFIETEALASRPNLFKIVGRTHTETWHSMFLGWLLDPNSSHGLGDFPLKRLLYSCTKPTISGKSAKFDLIAKFASLGKLENAKVFPNEKEQIEYQCEAGRLDVFIEFSAEDFDGIKTIILIEQKVYAKIDKSQCEKYNKWLKDKYSDCLVIPIILAPNSELKINSEETCGSSEWYGIDYQILHDLVLVPSSWHLNLNTETVYLINQYINTLRIPMKGNKLAITDEEKELAYALYEKHKEAFETIQAVLADEIDLKVSSKPTSETLKISINTIDIFGNSVREYYMNILKYLVDNKVPMDKLLPFETGPKRYLISKVAKHQRGNDFTAPIEYKGYFMETHKSIGGAATDILRFLDKLKVKIKY
jgi:hypothetical protein